MAWTAPRTWTTGEVVTAAILNTHVRDNLTALGTMIDATNGLTADAVLSGNGTGEVKQLALTDGQFAHGNASGVLAALQLIVSTASPVLRHEVGGIEADISAVAKGGIVAGTGTGTMGLLAVGSNDQVLVADSAEATGLKWSAQTTADIGARVYDASTQTLTTGSAAFINFDSETFDTDTMHDTVTNNTRLTATTAGKYLVIGQMEFAANATGERRLSIGKNGATNDVATVVHDAAASGETRIIVAGFVDLSATDYVQLEAWQNSGGNLNVSGGPNSSWFSAMRVAA